MTAILILGAAVWPNGPSPTLRRRTEHGAALFHAGAGQMVIACGGLGQHPPTEAEAMAALLRAAGVPDDATRLEDRSTNTRENIRFALPILEAAGERDILIVSDAYHLPRARMIARRHGLIVKVSAPPLANARLLPQLRGWLREGPAILAVMLGMR